MYNFKNSFKWMISAPFVKWSIKNINSEAHFSKRVTKKKKSANNINIQHKRRTKRWIATTSNLSPEQSNFIIVIYIMKIVWIALNALVKWKQYQWVNNKNLFFPLKLSKHEKKNPTKSDAFNRSETSSNTILAARLWNKS